MSIEKYQDPRAERLYEQIFQILKDKEPELAISTLINLLQSGFYAFALENGMDCEQFIVYVNAMLNELKKEAFREDRLEYLDKRSKREDDGDKNIY